MQMQAQTLGVNLPLHDVTMGPTYNEFGYNKHPAIARRFLYIKARVVMKMFS